MDSENKPTSDLLSTVQTESEKTEVLGPVFGPETADATGLLRRAVAPPSLDDKFPGMHLDRVAPIGGLMPNAGDLDRMFEPDESLPEYGEEIASNTDWEGTFGQRRPDGFNDSFDFAYDAQGNYIAVVRHQVDVDRDNEREDNAGKFAESFLAGLEAKDGIPVERSDTSKLSNHRMPHGRRVIHDDNDV